MTYKNPRSMSIEELKVAANNEAVAYYRQQMELDPLNPQAKAEYEQACYRANTRPDPELNRLQSLTTEQLANEWETRGKAVETKEQEDYRVEQAKIWVASQKRYAPTPEAASKIMALVDKERMQGSVADLQLAFDTLVSRGEIQAPPIPVAVYSHEELSQMSAADCKKALERMGFGEI